MDLDTEPGISLLSNFFLLKTKVGKTNLNDKKKKKNLMLESRL